MTTSVTFRWNHGGKHVLVAGSFSAWRTIPLIKEPSEFAHSITLKIRPGTHLYKYVVDGIWFYDIQANYVPDLTGETYNNVVTFKELNLWKEKN